MTLDPAWIAAHPARVEIWLDGHQVTCPSTWPGGQVFHLAGPMEHLTTRCPWCGWQGWEHRNRPPFACRLGQVTR